MFLRLALGTLMLLTFGVSGALAHASLLTAEPANTDVLSAAPAEVRLTFNEPVGLLAISLVSPGGVKQDLTAVSKGGETVFIPLPGDLPLGTEALTWHIVSEDGHPVGGTLIFSIGQVTGAASGPAMDPDVAVAIWLSRLLIYVGLFGGVGAFVFGAVAPLSPAARRIGLGLIVAGIVGAAPAIGLQGADGLGLSLAALADPKAWAIGWSTTFGGTIVAVIAAFVLAGLSAMLKGLSSKGFAALALCASGLSLALSGHASAADPQWLTRPAVLLHVTAICFWVGSLMPLALLMAKGGPDAERGLARFSAIIPWAIAPLLLSGIVLVCVQLGWPGESWLTPYAGLLAVKLGLLAVLFGLAAWNRWRLTRPAMAGGQRARWWLGLSVRAEIVVVLLILGVVAGWRFTPPPRVIAAELAIPAEAHIMSDKLMTMVTVLPGRAGPVGISLYLMDAEMTPVTPLSVKLELNQQSVGIGPITAEATLGPDGYWHADGLVLPVSGQWTITIEARTGKFDLEQSSGTIEIQ